MDDLAGIMFSDIVSWDDEELSRHVIKSDWEKYTTLKDEMARIEKSFWSSRRSRRLVRLALNELKHRLQQGVFLDAAYSEVLKKRSTELANQDLQIVVLRRRLRGCTCQS